MSSVTEEKIEKIYRYIEKNRERRNEKEYKGIKKSLERALIENYKRRIISKYFFEEYYTKLQNLDRKKKKGIKYCLRCDAPNEKDAEFCENCGYLFRKTEKTRSKKVWALAIVLGCVIGLITPYALLIGERSLQDTDLISSLGKLKTIMPSHSSTETSPPETTPPWYEEGYYSKKFEWEYMGRIWTYEMEISKSDYNRYQQMERYPYSEITKYITEDKSGVVERVAQTLREAADKKQYGEGERIYFAIAFVQGLPYYPDNVTSLLHNEWPKFPIETLVDGGGDCEDTSILVAALLDEWNYEVVLLELPGHMAVGVWCKNCYGSYVTSEGRDYFYLETTGEGWEIGDMPPEYKDAEVKIHDID